uniref:Uncharacterized protein n=1 Tax=Anguilla anguilla TaxID=7936 RepID=A0A0E9V8V1_ANGAN
MCLPHYLFLLINYMIQFYRNSSRIFYCEFSIVFDWPRRGL